LLLYLKVRGFVIFDGCLTKTARVRFLYYGVHIT
jgi:hypothetical protein